MRMHRYASALFSFCIGMFAAVYPSRWAETVSGYSRGFAARCVTALSLMGEFPTSAKTRFELTVAKWRMMSSAGEGLSADGLMKTSHHFAQIGSQEKPAVSGFALA